MADLAFTHTPVSPNDSAPSNSNPFPVQLTDGAGNDLAVNGNNRLEIAVEELSPYAFGDAHGATDEAVPLAAVRDDVTTTLSDPDGDYVPLRVNDEGRLWIAGDISVTPEDVHVDDAAFTVGTDNVGAIGALADETAPDSVDEGDIGLLRMTLDRKLLTRVVGSTDANRLEINASGRAEIDIASFTGVTPANPLPVEVQSGTGGTAVNDNQLDTAVAQGAGSAVDHDVAAGANGMQVHRVHVASSGAAKFEVYEFDGVSTETLIDTTFIQRQGGGYQFEYRDLIIANGDELRVKKENRQAQAQDLYSLIQATQLP